VSLVPHEKDTNIIMRTYVQVFFMLWGTGPNVTSLVVRSLRDRYDVRGLQRGPKITPLVARSFDKMHCI
jgi:predicted oxidoreductase